MIELFNLTHRWEVTDLELMAVNGYSTFPKAPGWESHNQFQFSVIPRTEMQFVYSMNPVNNLKQLYNCMKKHYHH